MNINLKTFHVHTCCIPLKLTTRYRIGMWLSQVLPVNYEPGDMAILVGPPEFRSNVRAYLSSIANFSDGVIVDL